MKTYQTHILPRKKGKKIESSDNEKGSYDPYAHMVHLFKKFIELVLLISVLSTVWEDTDGCENPYTHFLDIYLMNLLSSLYDITTDFAIYSPGHKKCC